MGGFFCLFIGLFGGLFIVLFIVLFVGMFGFVCWIIWFWLFLGSPFESFICWFVSGLVCLCGLDLICLSVCTLVCLSVCLFFVLPFYLILSENVVIDTSHPLFLYSTALK